MPYANAMNGMIKRRTATGAPAVNFGDAGSMQTAAQDQYGTEAGYGSDASSAYLARAKAFDPSAAIQQYAQGAWGSISEGLKRSIADQRGAEVGAGRFDSGFNDEDTGGVYRTATNQLANSIAQQAVTASGQTLQNNSQLAQFGESTTQDANDLLASEREFQANQAEQKKKNKGAKGSAIGGALGTAAERVLRRPVGAGIGGSIGSALGGLF
jgi:hypothetical protein